jgi:thiol:disulfide interchange protein
VGTVADGMTAALIFLAMAFGLIAPKLLIEHFCSKRAA